MKIPALLFLTASFVHLIIPPAFSQQITKPEDTEVWDPEPPEVAPGDYTTASAPSDAIILFDGSGLSAWQKPQFKAESATVEIISYTVKGIEPDYEHKPADWDVIDGEMVIKQLTGAIETKQAFGDMQLHIEWMTPYAEGKKGQGYSNSGIFLMNFYEIQVLNSYENRTYSNGQAGSIYKQHIPLVNACRKPEDWQVYDTIFKAPVFDEEGSLKSLARITAFHNGVLIHNNVKLKGPTVYIGTPKYVAHPAKLPLRLQDHGDPVRYRNIWVREL